MIISDERYHLLIIRDMALLVLIIFTLTLFMAGCAKQEDVVISKEYINYSYDGKVIDIAIKEGNIKPYEIEKFADDMRKMNKTILIKDLTITPDMKWLLESKNISPETKICFGNIDCLDGKKCITICRYETDEFFGTKGPCMIDEWKDIKDMHFYFNAGVCTEWKS